MDQATRPANRLLHETSLYLRQHAHNPVNWYPWGPEALQRARQEQKPIFLSIGFSACHWCHVMEHESFEDEETARFLNEHFISIKVDREERPDLDQIYMNAVTSLTGHGGWPMSVFLTPDLQPFYAGTYFPPEDRHGLPSFKRILQAIAPAWQHQREDLINQAGQVTGHLREASILQPSAEELGPELIRNAVRTLERIHDPTYGGFGRAPKFPHALELKLLLRAWKRFQNDDALAMARLTLDRMAMGGMYDHLGGGFHRYSTDARWLAPHFEKMLYDNALLSVTYLEAFQATGGPFYREVVEETLDWVLREMTSPEGAFYSTLDADSEGVEGKFYTWSARAVQDVLGGDPAELFAEVYDVTEHGNWEETNIPNRPKTYAQSARLLKMAEPELRARLREARQKLLQVRSRRVWPGRDEKILTAWNGLMIAAFAKAAQVLDAKYVEPAARAAEYLLTHLRGPDGQLFRTAVPSGPAKLRGYLEDYSFLIDALVSLYEATFDPRWLTEALKLTDLMIDQFWDEDQGGFYFVGRDHEPLIVRGKDPQDGSVPSGNSMAVTALLRLAKLTGRSDLAAKAERTLRVFGDSMKQAPTAFGQMLVALDFYLGPVDEIAVVGPNSSPDTRQALRLLEAGFRPNKVMAWLDTDLDETSMKAVQHAVPLLTDKTAVKGQVTTYVCRDFSCQAPIVGLEALREKFGGDR